MSETVSPVCRSKNQLQPSESIRRGLAGEVFLCEFYGSPIMRIGELAKTVDVNVETIRYYQRIGLLALPEKPYGGVRSYSDADLQRLRFIRRAQQLGFSLEDIRELLELSSSDCKRVEKLAAEKLNVVKARLTELRRIESILTTTVERCASRKGNQPCPIIETLARSKN